MKIPKISDISLINPKLLLNFNISYISYYKLYHNNYLSVISSHPNVPYEVNKNYNYYSTNDLIEYFILLEKQYDIKKGDWLSCPPSTVSLKEKHLHLDHFLLKYNYLNLRNVFWFFKRKKDKVLLCSISISKTNTINLYINNLNKIIELINYFEDHYTKNLLNNLILIKQVLINKPTIYNLTTREISCLEEFVKLKSSKEIANKFDISHRTVKTHLYNIRRKLNLKSKSDLFTYYNNL